MLPVPNFRKPPDPFPDKNDQSSGGGIKNNGKLGQSLWSLESLLYLKKLERRSHWKYCVRGTIAWERRRVGKESNPKPNLMGLTTTIEKGKSYLSPPTEPSPRISLSWNCEPWEVSRNDDKKDRGWEEVCLPGRRKWRHNMLSVE